MDIRYLLPITALLAISSISAMQRKDEHRGVTVGECSFENFLMPGMSQAREKYALTRAALMTSSALHGNASIGNVEWINKLIWEYHFPVNLLDYKGETPLHKAVESKQMEAIDALIRAGADPLIPNEQGVTALDKATPEIRAYIEELSPQYNKEKDPSADL
ncbi:MAG: ankyrin repeat domain-containing protein [bacterium]